MIFVEGKANSSLDALIKDLNPSNDENNNNSTNKNTKNNNVIKKGSKEERFISKVCAKAAFERVRALNYFSEVSVKESAAMGHGVGTVVSVKEPKGRWKLKIGANAPATNIRKAMGSVTGTYKNLFGTFGELNGCLAISPHSFRDLEGEVSYARALFLGGGRASLTKWVTTTPQAASALKGYLKRHWSAAPLARPSALTAEELKFERTALRRAMGEPCSLICGGRIEQCDKSKVSKLKKHSITAFASLSTAHHGSFGIDLTSYSILASAKRDSGIHPGLDGIRFRPHIHAWYKLAFGGTDVRAPRVFSTNGMCPDESDVIAALGDGDWNRFGWGASFLTEVMARIPCPGARHYRNPRHRTNFLRNTVAGIVKVPLGLGGAGLEVFGQCGALTGIGRRNPSDAMAALEEFENNSHVVRNMSLAMVPPNKKLASPVTAYYSVNATLGAPCPFLRRLSLAGFLDVGAVARPVRMLFKSGIGKPRATTGVALRISVGGGSIELTLGTSLTGSRDDDDISKFGISSAFSPF